MSYWILQANPKHYDIDSALLELDRIVWRVPQYTEEVRPGDHVVIWRSGKKAGVVGLGTVLTEPALAPPPEGEQPYVKDGVAEGSAETRVVLAVRGSHFVPKDVVSAMPLMAEHKIIRAPMGTVFPLDDEEWSAVSVAAGVEPPSFVDESTASPSSYPMPFSWKDRRKDTYPLPGGYDEYLTSLQTILELVARQRPSVDDLTTEVQTSLGSSQSNARYIVLFLKRAGFIIENAGLLEVSPVGEEFLQNGDGRLVVAQLHSRVRFIGELMALLDHPRTVDELVELANSRFGMGWNTKAQVSRRRGWLQSALLVEMDDENRLVLTAAGRELANQLVLHEPGAPVGAPHHDEVEEVQELPEPVPELAPDVVALVQILDTTSVASDSPDDFEYAIRDVFEYLGFRAEKLGGSGKTDVVADADLGLDDSYRVIIDGKTSAKGAIGDQQIDWDTIDEHRRIHDADYVVIAGPTFTGGRTRGRARDHNAILITAGDLGDLVRQHAVSPLGVDAYRALFATAGGDADLDALTDVVEEHERLLGISLAVLAEIEEHVNEVGALSARDLFLLLRSSCDLDAAEAEIADALEALASPLLRLLAEQDGHYRPTGPRTTAEQRLRVLGRALMGDAPEAE